MTQEQLEKGNELQSKINAVEEKISSIQKHLLNVESGKTTQLAAVQYNGNCLYPYNSKTSKNLMSEEVKALSRIFLDQVIAIHNRHLEQLKKQLSEI